jgi:hypothetical protein
MYKPRTKEIYMLTKQELLNGICDIEDYAPIIAGLIREEDFEACEGIKLAVAEYGIVLTIPEEE